jgi:hypothetical protein
MSDRINKNDKLSSIIYRLSFEFFREITDGMKMAIYYFNSVGIFLTIFFKKFDKKFRISTKSTGNFGFTAIFKKKIDKKFRIFEKYTAKLLKKKFDMLYLNDFN